MTASACAIIGAMKRHEALQELSRDHQHALAVALALTRADDVGAEAAAAGFLDFWRGEGRRHFQIEEDILLPAYAEHGDARAEPVVRVLADHVEIRRDAALLERGGAPDPAFLRALGERVQGHVRHEERVLFPMIEQALSDRELVALRERIAAAERSG